jgi:hypothetical protein
MVQSGAEVAGICATNDQLDESRPALTTRIKSRHESRSEIAPFALAFAKQGQLNLWLASTAICPSVPTTEKTLNKVASLTRSISGDHLSTGVARKISLDQPLSAYWIDPGSQRQSLAQVADAVAKAIAL